VARASGGMWANSYLLLLLLLFFFPVPLIRARKVFTRLVRAFYIFSNDK